MGLAQHQIARSCSIVQSTVHKYLKLAEAAQLRWPLPEELSDHKLDQSFRQTVRAAQPCALHPPPDFAAIHKELQPIETDLELLGRNTRAPTPGGYGYSRFCDLYREWSRDQNCTLRQSTTPAKSCYVDYAGATTRSRPRHRRGPPSGHLSWPPWDSAVTPLRRSTWSQELPCWIGSHIRAFEYIPVVCPCWWSRTIQIPESPKPAATSPI